MGATVCPEDADNKSLYWSSDDESIATVSQTGVITGRSAGRTTICVAALDGSAVTAECDVWVDPIPVISVAVAPPTLTMYVGCKEQLVATVLPEEASRKSVFWTSSDENIATVDQTGCVTAKKAGKLVSGHKLKIISRGVH